MEKRNNRFDLCRPPVARRWMMPISVDDAWDCVLRSSMSQWGEERMLLPTLIHKAAYKPGTFVELGALVRDHVRLVEATLLQTSDRCILPARRVRTSVAGWCPIQQHPGLGEMLQLWVAPAPSPRRPLGYGSSPTTPRHVRNAYSSRV